MKRSIAIALLSVLMISIMLLALGGCLHNSGADDAASSDTGDANDNSENSDGKQIPVYKGMTISPADSPYGKAD